MKVQRHHVSEALAELRAGDAMTFVGGKTRVIEKSQSGVIGESFREDLSGRRRPIHPDIEGSHASLGQPAVERATCKTVGADRASYTAPNLRVSAEEAQHRIAVSASEFAQAFHHQVGAESAWLTKGWGGKGVVDENEAGVGIRCVGSVANGLKIRDAHPRIGNRFNNGELRSLG